VSGSASAGLEANTPPRTAPRRAGRRRGARRPAAGAAEPRRGRPPGAAGAPSRSPGGARSRSPVDGIDEARRTPWRQPAPPPGTGGQTCNGDTPQSRTGKSLATGWEGGPSAPGRARGRRRASPGASRTSAAPPCGSGGAARPGTGKRGGAAAPEPGGGWAARAPAARRTARGGRPGKLETRRGDMDRGASGRGQEAPGRASKAAVHARARGMPAGRPGQGGQPGGPPAGKTQPGAKERPRAGSGGPTPAAERLGKRPSGRLHHRRPTPTAKRPRPQAQSASAARKGGEARTRGNGAGARTTPKGRRLWAGGGGGNGQLRRPTAGRHRNRKRKSATARFNHRAAAEGSAAQRAGTSAASWGQRYQPRRSGPAGGPQRAATEDDRTHHQQRRRGPAGPRRGARGDARGPAFRPRGHDRQNGGARRGWVGGRGTHAEVPERRAAPQREGATVPARGWGMWDAARPWLLAWLAGYKRAAQENPERRRPQHPAGRPSPLESYGTVCCAGGRSGEAGASPPASFTTPTRASARPGGARASGRCPSVGWTPPENEAGTANALVGEGIVPPPAANAPGLRESPGGAGRGAGTNPAGKSADSRTRSARDAPGRNPRPAEASQRQRKAWSAAAAATGGQPEKTHPNTPPGRAGRRGNHPANGRQWHSGGRERLPSRRRGRADRPVASERDLGPLRSSERSESQREDPKRNRQAAERGPPGGPTRGPVVGQQLPERPHRRRSRHNRGPRGPPAAR